MLVLLGLDRVDRGGRRPGAIRGIGDGRVGRAVAAEGEDVGSRARRRSGRVPPNHGRPEAKANRQSCKFAAPISRRCSISSRRIRWRRNIGLSSRVSLAGNKLTFDDLDSTHRRLAAARPHGGDARTTKSTSRAKSASTRSTLAPAFALAIGAAGHDAAEPLGAGLSKGWRGRIAFQALRGAAAGRRRIAAGERRGQERRPVADLRCHQGQDRRRRGVTASIDARPGANGIALNARVQFSGVDGTALRYRNLAMPAGRASMQMTLTSQGRSASALTGALSGSGTLTLESARIAGLDPRAFEVAVRASDSGQATDDVRLKQIVEPALPAGALVGRIGADSVQHQGRPDSRRRDHARCRMACAPSSPAGTIFRADQADIRASASPRRRRIVTSRPEIQLFAVGTPDALESHRRRRGAVVVAGGAGDRSRNRRLDAIERGEPLRRRHAAADHVLPPRMDKRLIRTAAPPSAPASCQSRPRSATASARSRAAVPRPPSRTRRQCAAPPRAGRRPAAGRAAAAADRRAARAELRRQAEAAAAVHRCALTPQVANPPPRSISPLSRLSKY